VRRQTGARPHRQSQRLAAAPAQRSLFAEARQARLTLARRLQLLQARRSVPFLKPGARVVDLGAAPGGWTQVTVERRQARTLSGVVIGIDITPVEPIRPRHRVGQGFLTTTTRRPR